MQAWRCVARTRSGVLYRVGVVSMVPLHTTGRIRAAVVGPPFVLGTALFNTARPLSAPGKSINGLSHKTLRSLNGLPDIDVPGETLLSQKLTRDDTPEPEPVPAATDMPSSAETASIRGKALAGGLTHKWRQRVRELGEYQKEHGHTKVPWAYKKNPTLGRWAGRQRVMYRKYLSGAKCPLTAERIATLNDLNFTWVKTLGWWERLDQLGEFIKEHGHTNVPMNYKKNPALGRWVETQRKAYRKHLTGANSSLTADKIATLNQMNFCWTVPDVWTVRLRQLDDFRKEHGHTRVPQKYKENPALGLWVSTQRQAYRKKLKGTESSLTPDRIAALTQIDFCWTCSDDRWNDRIRQVDEFRRRHGHTRIPVVFKENPALGSWVKTQRQAYRKYIDGAKSSLSAEKIATLNEMDFVWEMTTEWAERVRQLDEFIKEHSHAKVPLHYKENPALGRWVATQRQAYRQHLKGATSSLTAERIAILKQRDFFWNAPE